MTETNPYGPYSVEELSSMDDAELGRLYRRKNKNVDSGMTAFLGTFSSRYRLRKRSELGYDAFDNLYPHEDEPVFQRAFAYLCTNTSIRNGDDDLYNWISILKKVSSDDGSDYTDAELGQLLKIIIPALAYMKESGHSMRSTDFEVLDKEFNLTKQLDDFMETTYTEMLDRKDHERERKNREYETRLKAELDNEHEEAEQIAAKIKDKNKRYAEGLAELEKSADYRKMMDLKRTLDEKKKMLSEQVKTENGR